VLLHCFVYSPIVGTYFICCYCPFVVVDYSAPLLLPVVVDVIVVTGIAVVTTD